MKRESLGLPMLKEFHQIFFSNTQPGYNYRAQMQMIRPLSFVHHMKPVQIQFSVKYQPTNHTTHLHLN